MSNKFKRISISIIIILIIKVDYNYHKNYPRIIWRIFLWKLYNFDNFTRRRLSDHNKITFVSLSPSLSPDGAFFISFLLLFYLFKEGGDCYFFFETELSLTKQPLYLRPGRSEYSLLMKLLLIQIRKSLSKNDWDQVLWACKTELPIQTLVFTITAGHHNLLKVIVI